MFSRFLRASSQTCARRARAAAACRPAFHALERRLLLFGDPIFDLGTLDGANGFRIPGIAADGQLGFSTAGVGDMNGDGIDDFAVSAPSAGGSLLEGRVYVIFGGAGVGGAGQFDLASLDGTNGFVIEGAQPGGEAGWSLRPAGDVNGDQYGDLIVGVPFASSACVIFGGPSVGQGGLLSLADLDGTNGFVISSGQYEAIGFTTDGTGDVNLDGYDDVLLGSPTNFDNSGVAFVVFGGASVGSGGVFSVTSIDGSNGLVIPGVTPDNQFAWRVAHAGDLNDDGAADFVIGELGAGTNSAGAAYVIFGSDTIGQGSQGVIDITALDGSNGFVVRGLNANDFFSTSLSGGGDVNGDGVADLLVGSLIQNTFVIFGASGIGAGGLFDLASLDGSNGYIAFLPNGAAAFVTHAGDLNNDGVGDVAIGAAGSDEVYVYVGGASVGGSGLFDVSTVNGENGFLIQGVRLAAGFVGEPISRGKDLNNDGRPDLLIGAALANQDAGEAYAIFGVSTTGVAAPSALSATALDSMSIELQWTDNSLIEDGFEIERSLDGVSNWVFVTSAPPGNGSGGMPTYQDGSLQPETTYYYRVRAFRQNTFSAYSNIASATTQGAPSAPAAPSGLTASAVSEFEIRLDWIDNSSDESGFIIERALDPNGQWSGIDTTGPGATTYSDTTVSPGQAYYYRVRAFNDFGQSAPSNVAGATTSPSQGGSRRVEHLDTDGDLVTFSLVGVGGTITLSLSGGEGGTFIDTLYVAVDQVGVGSLVVNIVRASEGDGRVQIGQLLGDISSGDQFVRAGAVNFALVDVVGGGVWLCNVNRAEFGDLLGSASIEGQVADLRLRDVDTSGSISLCDVYRFSARSLALGGGFEANSVFIFNVSADADFSLTMFGAAGLGTMFIGGRADVRLDVSSAGVIDIRGDADFAGGAAIADGLARLVIGGSWLGGSLTVGRLVGKIVVVGDVAAGASLTASRGCVVVCGNSAGTFNLDRFARFVVKGEVLGGAVNFTDSANAVVCISGNFAAGAFSADSAGLWRIKVFGSVGAPASVDIDGRLQNATIRGDLAGDVRVQSTDCIIVCTDFTGSFTADGLVGETVRKFVVKGAADGSRFAAVGDVRCVDYGKMDDAEVFVGLPPNWSGGLPQSLGEFLRQSVLHKLQVRGETRGATVASALIANFCAREISPEIAFRLAAAHVDRAKLIVENVPYNLGPDAIFTDLPMRQYLDIRQLFESGGV